MQSARVDQRTASPTVAVFGEWSGSNLGDHAIHEGVQSFFLAHGWRTQSYDFGALCPTHGATVAVDAGRGGGRHRLMSTWTKRTIRGWRQQLLIRRLLPRLRDVDVVCVGGGALLSDLNLHFPQSLAAIRWAAEQLDRPVLCLGCSVEDSWSPAGERLVRDFAERCTFIATRDQASADQMGNMLGSPVPVFGDFALPLERPTCRPRPPRAHGLALNVTHVPAPFGDQQPYYEDALVELALRYLDAADTRRRVAVFTTGTREDRAPAHRVRERLGSIPGELRLCSSLAELRALVCASDLVVAARLHAAIIALAEQVPVLGFAVTPKIGNFFASVGLDDCSFDLLDPVEQVAAAAHAIRRNPPRPAFGPASPIRSTREQVSVLLRQLECGQRLPRRASA